MSAPGRTDRRRALAGAAVSVAVVAGLVWWVVAHGAETGAAVRSLRPWPVAGALLLACAGAVVAAESWRGALAGLGPVVGRRTALRICLVGQLGKYLPGSLWPALMQAELGRRRNLPRAAVLTAFAVSLVGSMCGGAVVGSAALLGAGATPSPWALAVAVGGASAFVLLLAVPALLGRPVTAAVRRLGGGTGTTVPGSSVRRCLLLAALGWTVNGAHVWCLAVGLGADPLSSVPATVGGLALATVVGTLAVVAPGGLGAREVVLVASLSTVLPPAAALVVALASRLITLAAECLVALVATVSDRLTARSADPSDAHPEPIGVPS